MLRDIFSVERNPKSISEVGGAKMDTLSSLELVLGRVGALSGMGPTIGVTAAKSWLREQGGNGPGLASMLGQITKDRNATAHPKAFKLLGALEQLPAKVVAEPDHSKVSDKIELQDMLVTDIGKSDQNDEIHDTGVQVNADRQQVTTCRPCAIVDTTQKEQKFVDIKQKFVDIKQIKSCTTTEKVTKDIATKPAIDVDDGAPVSVGTQSVCLTSSASSQTPLSMDAISTSARFLKSLSEQIQDMPNMSKKELLNFIHEINETTISTTGDVLEGVLAHRDYFLKFRRE